MLAPRRITKWENGVRTSILITPTPFDKKRAEEIFGQVKYFWEEIVKVMTDGEIAYVDKLYEENMEYSTWMGVFFEILNGRI